MERAHAHEPEDDKQPPRSIAHTRRDVDLDEELDPDERERGSAGAREWLTYAHTIEIITVAAFAVQWESRVFAVAPPESSLPTHETREYEIAFCDVVQRHVRNLVERDKLKRSKKQKRRR